jgi:hypothetical protein
MVESSGLRVGVERVDIAAVEDTQRCRKILSKTVSGITLGRYGFVDNHDCAAAGASL